jgi:hypothetical protein
MGFFTTIHIVTIEKLDTSLERHMWFWDETEARDAYNEALDEVVDTRIVTRYSIDLNPDLDKLVASFMANRHSSINRPELVERETNLPDTKRFEPEYTLLRNDGDRLYIERTMGGEFWSYTVSKHGSGWHVRDFTGRERLGAIYQDDPKALMPKYTVEFDGKESGHAADLQKAVELLIELDMIYGQ